MRPNILVEKLREGQVVLGLAHMFPSAGIVELMCPGWDFVWIDGQHGQYTYDTIANSVRAAQLVGVDTLIRVPGHEYGIIGPMADLSPSAIMVPMVNNVEEALTIVKALRFHPLGQRSYGGRRVVDLHGREYFQRDLLVVAQIETLEGIANVDAIVNTEGIDAVFFGPDDVKMQLGLPINTGLLENERLRGAAAQTAAAARRAGKVAATVATTPELLRACIDMGYRMLIGGGDVVFLRALSAPTLATLRDAITGAQGA